MHLHFRRILKIFVVPVFSSLLLFVSAPLALAAHPSVAIPSSPFMTNSGIWGGVKHYTNTPAGTYYVRAWTIDAFDNWSLTPSASLQVNFVTPPISATCVVTPTSGLTTNTFTWSVDPTSLSGGGGPNSYSYAWSGGPGTGDSLAPGSSGTTYITGGTYAEKKYSTAGTKYATTTITSGGISQDFHCPDVVVSLPAPNLTASGGSVSPNVGTTKVAASFTATITNNGTANASNFPNVFQVQKVVPTSVDPSGWTTVERVPMYNTTIGTLAYTPGINTAAIAVSSYLFSTAGTYRVRACADMDTAGNIFLANESNKNDNCDTWQSVTIYPELVASCAVSPASGLLSTSYHWSATVSGGSGTYTYSWTGTNLSGSLTSSSFDKTYTTTTTGVKSASVTVTSANSSKTVTCANTASVVSGTLSTTPASCTIASGSSTCTVSASWTSSNATGAYLFDHNVSATLYTGNSSSGSMVWVARPQTVFNLKNGNGLLLASATTTASCVTGSTWNGSVCLANTGPANGSCSATHYSCLVGTSGSNVNGPTSYTWTCASTNGGTTASCTENKAVVNGACAPTHYACTPPGTSGSNVNGPTSYTWTCAGTNGGTTASCSEAKAPAASGALTMPSSCVIAANASTCIVEASWDLSDTVDAYLFDANPHGSGILYGKGVGSIPSISGWNGTLPNGHIDPPVYVAYPQTVFNLYNGNGTVLDSATVASSCTPGTAWDGTACIPSTYSCTNLPLNANPYPAPDTTGLAANTVYTYSSTDTAAKCEYNCSNGYNWSGSACVANALNVSCVGTPGNPYVSQSVTWSSTASGGSGSYSYAWSGDESLSGTTNIVTKTYAAAGVKLATVTVTDTNTKSSGSMSCSTGTAQPNGPMAVDTGGQGVSVGACASTLTANPDRVVDGNNTYLTWSVTGGALCASSCSGDPGFNAGTGQSSISGNNVPASVKPVYPSSLYSLTCQPGTYGPPPPANTSVAVTIPAPVVSVNGQTGATSGSTNPTNDVAVLAEPAVQNQDNVTITWQPPLDVVISSCSITKNGAVWDKGIGLGSSGTVTDSVTTKTAYVIDCQNQSGKHAKRTILVNIILNYQEF